MKTYIVKILLENFNHPFTPEQTFDKVEQFEVEATNKTRAIFVAGARFTERWGGHGITYTSWNIISVEVLNRED